MPKELTDRQKYNNIQRARKAIVGAMARELDFSQEDLQRVADAVAARDQAQRDYMLATREVAHKTLRQLQ